MTKLITKPAVANPDPVRVPCDSRIFFFAFTEQIKAATVVIGTIGIRAQTRLAIASLEVFGAAGMAGGDSGGGGGVFVIGYDFVSQ